MDCPAAFAIGISGFAPCPHVLTYRKNAFFVLANELTVFQISAKASRCSQHDNSPPRHLSPSCSLSIRNPQLLIWYNPHPLCNLHRKEGSIKLLSKFDLIPLLPDFSLGPGIDNHVFLPRISSRRVNADLILLERNSVILGGGSFDYGLNSTCRSEWKSFGHTRFEVRSH